MSAPSLTFLDRASTMVGYGVPVVPLPPCQKYPPPKGWKTFATSDIEIIKGWLVPNGKPAIATEDSNCGSVATRNGFCFFEIDRMKVVSEQIEKDTGHKLQEIQTFVVRSSGEKRHLYFRQNDATRALGNMSCKDVDGAELFSLRGNGEYVVSPSSIHPDTGNEYEIVNGADIIEAPVWLTDWLKAAKRSSSVRKKERTADETAKVPKGGRDEFLFAKACDLRDAKMSQKAALAALLVVNTDQCVPPMSAAVVETKIKSAYTRDARKKTTPHSAETFVESGTSPTSDLTDEPQQSSLAPVYPTDTIDGDLIGDLTHALSDGTFIPPQFVRENIKVAFGLILDGLIGFPNHEDIHTREYLHNVSMYPQSGKGESYKRTSQPSTGFIFDLLREFGGSVIDGGLFGSGEFMVKVLKDAPTHRALARFDEMSEIWAKNRAIGCTLEKKLLTLFESTSAAQGSFKNGVNTADDFHLGLVGDFTKESFDASFTGSGSRGSGYLSRCIFQFADRQPWAGDWLPLDTGKIHHILFAISARLTEIANSESRYVPTETDEAKTLRLEFYTWLDAQDARFTPRLKDHLKRDALMRAIFGGGVITAEMMQRSIAWCKNQLDNRLALFPEDAGSLTEIMERTIIRTLKTKAQVTERELKRACHVDRAGSGGHEVFNRALRSLLIGHEIKPMGKTRKGLPIYALFDAI